MSILGKGILMLGADTAGLNEDLQKAGKSAQNFDAKIKALPESGEKLRAGFSNLTSIGATFQNMETNVSGFEKAVTSANMAISGMTVGLQIAMKATSGLKAALLGSGIGALILGAGYLVSRLSASRDVPRSSGPEPIAPLAEMTRTLREAPVPGESSTRTEVRRAMGDLEGYFRGLESTLFDTRPEIEAMRGRWRSAIARARPMLGEAVAAMARSETVDSLTGMEGARTRSRDMAATMGMSADDAEEYAINLRRTERSIMGVTFATTESITPLEAHNRRLAEIADMERRSGTDMTAARLESINRMHAEVAMLEDVRAARLAAAGAAERERVRNPLEIQAQELERMGSLFRRGGTDWETYSRGVEMMLGDMRSPLERTADRIREIGQAWEAAGEMAAGFGLAFDDSRFRAATATSLLDLARSVPGGPTMAAGLTRGSSEAISEVNRISMQQQFEDPVERVRLAIERQTLIQERQRQELEAISRALSDGTIVVPGVS